MSSEQPLCESLRSKIHEQMERTGHLIRRIPAERLSWKPATPDAWPVDVLLGHLLDCMAGFCAVFAAAEPSRLAHWIELQGLQVNHACSPADAISRIAVYQERIDEGFALLTDADLARAVPTVFVKTGEPFLTLLLGNLEHLINHKHELFTCLKQMG